MKTYLLKTSPAVEPKARRKTALQKSTPTTTATKPGSSASWLRGCGKAIEPSRRRLGIDDDLGTVNRSCGDIRELLPGRVAQRRFELHAVCPV